MLPKEDFYAPPMNIKVKDHRSFGRKPVVGFHIIKSLELFRCNPTVPSLSIVETTSNIFSFIIIKDYDFLKLEPVVSSAIPSNDDDNVVISTKKSLKKKKSQKVIKNSFF